MKVIVFGATGAIGVKVIEQSLERGHQVTAFSRTTDKLSPFSSDVKKISGDVTKIQDVRNAIKGHDVVCIVLGSGKQRKSTVRSEGTKNIIQAMKENGISRLICQTTLGCGDSKGNLNFFWKNIMFGWFLKQVFLDHQLQEEYVKGSGLDWTIVRPAAFTDGPKTEKYKHGFSDEERSLTLKISKLDIAHFILKEIQEKRYLHQTPGLSY